MKIPLSFVAATFLGAVLVGCGSPEKPTPPDTSSSSTESTAQSTPASSATSETTAESAPSPPTSVAEPAVAEAPVIVDCQTGLGPVQTYWSDGSVTGYSEYCQSVHDQVLQAEVDANSPRCDGTVCRYPSGAVIPDPNATPDDRCTNQINYANDPRSNAEINSIGAQTGQCPEPIS